MKLIDIDFSSRNKKLYEMPNLGEGHCIIENYQLEQTKSNLSEIEKSENRPWNLISKTRTHFTQPTLLLSHLSMTSSPTKQFEILDQVEDHHRSFIGESILVSEEYQQSSISIEAITRRSILLNDYI